MEDWAPKCIWLSDVGGEKPAMIHWQEGPSLEQVMFPEVAVEHFRRKYPIFHAYFTEAPKIPIKPGKEVPRIEALQLEGFWKAMEREIDSLKENGAVFAPPPKDKDSVFTYSSRWFFTENVNFF